MTYTGLMIATNSTSVSDNIVSNYVTETRNEDFQVQKFYKLYHHQGADNFGYSEFTDSSHPVIIEQSNVTWTDEDFMIIRYRLINNSVAALNDLSVGIFADWDLGDKTQNYAEYNTTNDYIYVRNSTGDLYAGVNVIGGDIPEFSAMDMGLFNGNSQDIDDVFNDASKYDYLINQDKLSAGGMGAGNDVATINGTTINQIPAYGETFINVIYAVANTQANLETEFQTAEDRLNGFLLKPRVLETFYTCDGASFQINPANGENFDFYEDPLAQDYISSGTSLNVTSITTDTSFYVKNRDKNYPSDIFEVKLKLLNEIADFSMSTDTLYLDHPTTNVVQFTDLSLDAISWAWNFGQGTASSIQNPMLSFSEAGTYSISLSIENEQGCDDTIIKQLVVASRPDSPEIADIVLCPDEHATIHDPTAEKLHLFAFANQTEPNISGLNIEIGPIKYDTTIYVSGVYGSFESDRIPLQIDVMEVVGSFIVAPDTASAAHQMLFSATQLDEGSTIRWFIDNELAGSDLQVTEVADPGEINVILEITSADNCIRSIEKDILISTSTFAIQEDVTSCSGDSVVIAPENGTYFGFYADPELTEFIKKGTSLKTNNYEKVYVVGLDDGLPGTPIEVNIIEELLEVEISYEAEMVGGKHRVGFAPLSVNEIDAFQWFINGDLSETIENPTFSFDNTSYEIVLQVESYSGCTASDTLNLDFTPPLGLDMISEALVYPNPSTGVIHLAESKNIDQVSIYSLNGKIVWSNEKPQGIIDLSDLKDGMYVVKITKGTKIYEGNLLLR